jgi:hypothetical protein
MTRPGLAARLRAGETLLRDGVAAGLERVRSS